jgi:diaminohydroxyphosphoribosylaminopyrimidine deaminase/5-amino-6-(5-phosphoribosylamino)uracil reductase
VKEPNTVAAGGAEWLRARGVEVELGLMAEEAAAQNASFLQQVRDATRPFVALKLATTIDGRIADANGHARWLSEQPARDFVQWLRAGFDAVAVGGVTAREDDPSLTVRGPLQPRTPPSRVVFAADGDVPVSLKLVRTAREVPTVVVTSPTAPGSRLAPLEAAGVPVVRAPRLSDALRQLRRQGIGSLLVEGGGRLAGALLAEDLVDRYYWVQSPLWLGASAVPAVAGLPTVRLADARRWRVAERRAMGDDTLLVLDRP